MNVWFYGNSSFSCGFSFQDLTKKSRDVRRRRTQRYRCWARARRSNRRSLLERAHHRRDRRDEKWSKRPHQHEGKLGWKLTSHEIARFKCFDMLCKHEVMKKYNKICNKLTARLKSADWIANFTDGLVSVELLGWRVETLISTSSPVSLKSFYSNPNMLSKSKLANLGTTLHVN